MHKILTYLLLFAVLISNLSAQTRHIPQLPSMVGPEVYEIYTDAGLFITHVYVNNYKLDLSNAEGNGRIGRKGHNFGGPIGYHNKVVINPYMQEGDNHIKIVYEPSPIIKKILEKNVLDSFKDEIFTRLVFIRGQLKNSSLGVESEKLDKLLKEKASNVNVLKNTFLDSFSKKDLTSEIVIEHTFTLHKKDKVEKSTIKHCSLDTDSSNDFKGSLYLNSTLMRTFNKNSSREEGGIRKNLKQGKNEFIFKISDSSEMKIPGSLELFLECKIDPLEKKLGFPKEYRFVRFGKYGKVYIPLARISLDNNKDQYAEKFTINFDDGSEAERLEKLRKEKELKDLTDAFQQRLENFNAAYKPGNEDTALTDFRKSLTGLPDTVLIYDSELYNLCKQTVKDYTPQRKVIKTFLKFIGQKRQEKYKR